MPPPAARIPVKLHKQVSLIRTAEPIVTEELMARKSLRGWSWGGCQRRCCWSGRRRKALWTSCAGWGTHRGSSAEGQAIMDEGHDQEGLGSDPKAVAVPESPSEGYREALGRYEPGWLHQIVARLNAPALSAAPRDCRARSPITWGGRNGPKS